MKKTIKINESTIKQLVLESLKRVLNEEYGFKFREGDKVIVHSKKNGDFEGTIDNYDYSMTTYLPNYDIETSDGRTVIGVPESAIELISQGDDETYKKLLSRNKQIRDWQNKGLI